MSTNAENFSDATLTNADSPKRFSQQDANGGNALPTYLTTISHSNEPIIVSDIQEDENEVGDGDKSDDDGDHQNDFVEALNEVQSERYGYHSFHNENDDIEDVAGDSEANGVVCKPIDLLQRGANKDVNWPKPPDDWVNPEPNKERDEPIF